MVIKMATQGGQLKGVLAAETGRAVNPPPPSKPPT